MKRLLFAVAAIAVALPAQAQNTGLYVGASLGSGKFQVDEARIGDAIVSGGSSHTGVTSDDRDAGWKAFVGYRFNRHLAIEGALVHIGEFAVRSRVTTPIPAFGTTVTHDVDSKVKVRSSLPVVSALGILPLGDRFSLYGRLGIHTLNASYSILNVSGSDDKAGLVYGFGADIDITHNVAVRAEWERYADVGRKHIGRSDADLLTLGVLVRFK